MSKILETGEWVIAQVCYDGVDPWCLESFWNLAHHLVDAKMSLPILVQVSHTYVTQARQTVAEQVVEVSKSIPIKGILWIDADMQFGPWDVISILQYAEQDIDLSVIGALYPARRSEGMVGKYLDPKIVHPCGLRFAEHLGFGLIWTPMHLFFDLNSPWFFEPWDPDRKQFTGEDIAFCNRWKFSGHPILAYESVTVRHAYAPGPRPLDDSNRSEIPTIKTW